MKLEKRRNTSINIPPQKSNKISKSNKLNKKIKQTKINA